MALTLAARSPQRRAILEQLGIEFTVAEPSVEEIAEGEAEDVVLANALAKARSAAAPPGAPLVLGVDTAVELDNRLFGKPGDEAEARSFLRVLEGRMHRVWSGLVLIDAEGNERQGTSVTHVRFRQLGPREIDWYAETGEWRGRAGGYAIQERGAALVDRVEGDYTNVVGLPVGQLIRLVPQLLTGGRR